MTEDPKAFLKTAVAFEDLAVEAYKGQAPRLQSEQVLAAALGIHTVEARHAAWMRYLNGITPGGVRVRRSAAEGGDRPDRARDGLRQRAAEDGRAAGAALTG